MNKKLRQLALLMLTLCFAGSMALLASAESEIVDCPTCGEQPAEIVGKVDETCTEDGYTGDICCSNCHKVIEEGSVIEAQHLKGNEDTLEGIKFVWSGYGDTVELRTVVTCIRSGCEEVLQDFSCPEELIGSEVVQEATCQKNQIIRYWMTGDPECAIYPDYTIAIPNSTVEHSNADDEGEFVWSFDAKTETASLVFSANCQWCGIHIEDSCPQEYIVKEVVQKATCKQDKELRFWMKNDPEQKYVKEYPVTVTGSKLDHEFGDSGPSEYVWSGYGDTVKLTAKGVCGSCGEPYEETVPSEYISSEVETYATCQNNKKMRYYIEGNSDIPEHVVEIPDSKAECYVNFDEPYEYVWEATAESAALAVKGTCEICGKPAAEYCPDELITRVVHDATCQENQKVEYIMVNDPEHTTIPECIVEVPNSTVAHEGDDHGPYQFVWSITEKYPYVVSLKAVGRCEWCKEMVAEVDVPSEYIKSEIVKKETCTSNRIERYWCTLDPDNFDCELPDYTVEIPWTGIHHNATVWSYDIDFTSDTTATVEFVCDFICSECGHADGYHTVPVTVDAIEAKKPTCSSDGYVVVPDVSADQQTNGDKVTTIIPIVRKGGTIVLSANESGHVPATKREGVVAATCTSNGYTGDLYCTECGELIEAGKTIAALGHDYSNYYANNDATCTSGGTGTAYCSRCGDMDTITLTAANGHVRTVVNARAATCTSDGYTGDTVCSVCGKTLSKGSVISATGHNYIAVDEDYSVCSLCGAEQGTPRLTTVEDVVVEVAEDQGESAPAASLVVRTTVAAPSVEAPAEGSAQTAETKAESNVQILTIEYTPEVIVEDTAADQQEEKELTIKLPVEQVEGFVLYLVKEDGTKVEIPVVYENGKAVIKLNYRLNIQNNWVIRMVPADQV